MTSAWLVFRSESAYREAVGLCAAMPISVDDARALAKQAHRDIGRPTDPTEPGYTVDLLDALDAVRAERRARREQRRSSWSFSQRRWSRRER